MNKLSKDDFAALIARYRIKPRLRRELRFTAESMSQTTDLELLAVTTRSGNEGILLIELDELYVVPYEIKRSIADSLTGRSKPIICDFCHTWQKGGNGANITFVKNDTTTVTFLCCADLACSMHVRDRSPESALSRSQLREDISTEQRVARLRRNLRKITELK